MLERSDSMNTAVLRSDAAAQDVPAAAPDLEAFGLKFSSGGVHISRMNDLPDDLAAKSTIHYYLDARDALLKALEV